MRHMPRPGWGVVALLLAAAVQAAPLEQARALRADGRLHQALGLLQQDAPESSAETRLERIGLLIDLGRLPEAEAALSRTLEDSSGLQRAQLQFEAGRLARQQERRDAALQAFNEAARLAGTHQGLRQRAQLAALALQAPAQRGAGLLALEPLLDETALRLQLAELALPTDPALTGRLLRQVQQSPQASPRQQLEALDQLAALHEARGEREPALALSRQALTRLDELPEAQQGDLRVRLEWRAGRLQSGAAALAAHLRAVAQLESLRVDWPLRGGDGRSSYESLFEPLYQGLVDGLLRAAAAAPSAGERQLLLRQARDAIEQLRQAELQDYLGDRCDVDELKGGSPTELPARTAVIYPLLLGERLLLLAEDRDGLVLRESAGRPAAVRETAQQLARQLRERDAGFLPAAQALHHALLQPLQDWLDAGGHQTLVWVNEGVLRLVPMAALHDGRQFAVERYALVHAQGMSMTNTQAAPGAAGAQGGRNLVAGAERFGPVVERLAEETWAAPLRRQMLGSAAESGTRSVQEARLRDALELPGVGEELSRLGQLLPGPKLRDAGFTVERFGQRVQLGGHRVVHIASHGVFGGSAADSYLLAYDDLLTLDRLQGLLQSEAARRQPIELLTLSACQTAEGNARAPMGIAGAALKARARAVLGTLWPVDDSATVGLMQAFYGSWQQQGSKGDALRAAQLGLLAQADTRHPYYWAPFALIGNWR